MAGTSSFSKRHLPHHLHIFSMQAADWTGPPHLPDPTPMDPSTALEWVPGAQEMITLHGLSSLVRLLDSRVRKARPHHIENLFAREASVSPRIEVLVKVLEVLYLQNECYLLDVESLDSNQVEVRIEYLSRAANTAAYPYSLLNIDTLRISLVEGTQGVECKKRGYDSRGALSLLRRKNSPKALIHCSGSRLKLTSWKVYGHEIFMIVFAQLLEHFKRMHFHLCSLMLHRFGKGSNVAGGGSLHDLVVEQVWFVLSF